MTERQKINWKRSGDIPVLQDVSKGAVHMLQFPLLEQHLDQSRIFYQNGRRQRRLLCIDEFELYQGR